MIDLATIIRHFWPDALALQLSEAEMDRNALEAVKNPSIPKADRIAAVQRWLHQYRVLMGFTAIERAAIAEAVLAWADSQDESSNIESLDALVTAHNMLIDACSIAYGKSRRFTSLASKAVWLRYPEIVPLFDDYANCALCVITKMESGIAPPAREKSEYSRFAYMWKALYERYASTIATLDMQEYPYRVRVFDKVLWILGSPDYSYEKSK